jgi:hypothetical protein
MIKLLKPDPPSGGKNIGRLMDVFTREVHLYENLLPALNKLGSVKFCPVIFSDLTEGKEALVLEHMKQHGWRDPFNKKSGLTLEHVKLVVDWLANFHGLSYKFITQYPGGVEAWSKDNPWYSSLFS